MLLIIIHLFYRDVDVLRYSGGEILDREERSKQSNYRDLLNDQPRLERQTLYSILKRYYLSKEANTSLEDT